MIKIPYTWKLPILPLNPWNFELEINDRVVDMNGNLYRLSESRGRNKKDSGELTPVKIKPPCPGLVLKKIDGEWFWIEQMESDLPHT